MQVCTTQAASCRALPIGASKAAAAVPTTNRTAATHRQQPTRVRHARSTQVQSVSQDSLAAFSAVPAAAAGEGPQALYPEDWEQCVVHLQSMGFAEADAGTYVQRAFGWGAKARSYWRHEKREEAPSLEQIEAVVEFLQGLGMDDLQVSKTIKFFPEVLGCAVDSQLQGNVTKLQQEWKLEGDVLRGAVLRNPALLGYNVDCMGDCAGECNRCWVRF